MSENEFNGQSDVQSESSQPTGPRIRPPEGLRMARGQYPSEIDETAVDSARQEQAVVDPFVEEEVFPPTPVREEQDAGELYPVVQPVELDTSRFNGNGHYDPATDPNTPNDKELGLFEHLAELRIRLLYSFMALGVGMCVTWNWGKPLQDWFAAPIVKTLKESGAGATLITRDPAGAFTAYFVFSLASGLILAMPFILFQVWRFIEPALTNNERKYTLVLVPFSTILFFLGSTLGYYCSPLFFKFFLIWVPEGVLANWDYVESITLMAKMLLVFGLSFQVPIIIIFLNKLGMLTRNLLIDYWRHAVVVIFTVIAILTPTWDPVTLAVCATPPCLLYALSIWLIKWL